MPHHGKRKKKGLGKPCNSQLFDKHAGIHSYQEPPSTSGAETSITMRHFGQITNYPNMSKGLPELPGAGAAGGGAPPGVGAAAPPVPLIEFFC